MTLTLAALQVLEVAQSGSLESLTQPLAKLSGLLKISSSNEDLSSAMAILLQAQTAASTHRTRIVQDLQQLDHVEEYVGNSAKQIPSWEMSA